ncbi:MAG: threonine--tRNA ligase [Halobacteriovoraceae bacterium]|nr:threonine--tRNA ligase [Halobacteriovoraceae bacterium]
MSMEVKELKKQFIDKYEWTEVDKNEFKTLTLNEQLKRIRHSASHVLAQAVEQIQGNIQLATGPATKDGFFYDIKVLESIDENALSVVQKEMQKICKQNQKFEWAKAPKKDVIEFYTKTNQKYKLEVIEKIEDETLTIFKNGEFLDMCAGPHVPHTGLCKNFKLTTATSAHWRDEQNPSLTRIAGTAWTSPEELQSYLNLLKEMKKRDHRTLGRQMGLFFFHDWASSALWEPKGVQFRKTLEKFWQEYLDENGYQEILNPQLYRKDLFQTSGHWDHFQENMFIFRDDKGEAEFILKPMNCPDTMLYFRSRVRSYKDLPMRIAEGQILHRNESHGSLHGIMRTRCFCQDDAHIFLNHNQIQTEILTLLQNIKATYDLLGLEFRVNLSTRPANYMGEIEAWNKAEAGLEEALKFAGTPYRIDPGEGAFYGPKLDITILDSLGRQWQCGTIQLDFQLPERFELKYTEKDGSENRPIVIHRAIFGSFERFMGILIEHFGGAFPTWLAPVQVAVLPLGESQLEYSCQLVEDLKKEGLRAVLLAEESLNYRIRQSQGNDKIPNLFIIGDKEVQNKQITLRKIKDESQKTISKEEAIELLSKSNRLRSLDVIVDNPAQFLKEMGDVTTENSTY